MSDDVFNGNHPNNINEGYYEIGILDKDITVGERCIVRDHFRYLHTSVITEILDENTFKTRNSTYRIEKLDNNQK